MIEDALIRKVPVVLQSCTVTSVASPSSAPGVIVMNFEDSVGVNAYGQLIAMPVSFPAIMAAPDQVSYVYMRPFLDTSPLYRNASGSLMFIFLCLSNNSTLVNENFFLVGVGGCSLNL
jgi:hypothetical protein